MISRKSAIAIAELYTSKFSSYRDGRYGGREYFVLRDEFYDYLYELNYPAWLANMVKKIFGRRELKEWLMQIHTGESLAEATPKWTWEKRKELGQEHLRSLATDFVAWFAGQQDQWTRKKYQEPHDEMLRRLELDGYVLRDGQLWLVQPHVLDVEAEMGLLQALYVRLLLPSSAEASDFLQLAESHYVAGRWSDAISNSRKFFELTLHLVAAKYAETRGVSLGAAAAERPVLVRDFLETQGLLEHKEREAVYKIYGLLSHTGAHPYMAEEDQARLLRQLALTTSQFVLLRLEGALGQR